MIIGFEMVSIKYLRNEKEVKSLGLSGDIREITSQQKKEINGLSKKERALRFQGFLITDESNSVVFEDKKRYSLHFFPLSVIDYAGAMYDFERSGKRIPILSVDSHDVLRCDFRCEDCLSAHGTNFPLDKFPKDNFNMGLDTYKHILKQIVEYSGKRGFKGVRFEQSGEGNPDFYANRKEILEYSKEIGMQSVYVSTGSRIDKNLMDALVENSSFIRISFPGIGNNAYESYSNQNKFSFSDAINKVKHLIEIREKKMRKDLMIGARATIRPEHSEKYFEFAKDLKNMGVDSLQIVKILVPEGKKPLEFPLSKGEIENIEKTEALDDNNFNVSIPHSLDYMFYSREIENRDEFPPQCFSALFQPVLAGRSLFVCTISNVMYSPSLKLGTFEANKEGLERFLSSENLDKVAKGIPSTCQSCSNIYDNNLLFSLQKLFRSNKNKLNFYEVLR